MGGAKKFSNLQRYFQATSNFQCESHQKSSRSLILLTLGHQLINTRGQKKARVRKKHCGPSPILGREWGEHLKYSASQHFAPLHLQTLTLAGV